MICRARNCYFVHRADDLEMLQWKCPLSLHILDGLPVAFQQDKFRYLYEHLDVGRVVKLLVALK